MPKNLIFVRAPGASLVLASVAAVMNARQVKTRADDLVEGACAEKCPVKVISGGDAQSKAAAS